MKERKVVNTWDSIIENIQEIRVLDINNIDLIRTQKNIDLTLKHLIQDDLYIVINAFNQLYNKLLFKCTDINGLDLNNDDIVILVDNSFDSEETLSNYQTFRFISGQSESNFCIFKSIYSGRICEFFGHRVVKLPKYKIK